MKKQLFIFTPLVIITILMGYLLISGKGINDIALSGLQTFKSLKGDRVTTTNFNLHESQPISHKIWDKLLKKHVASNGLVNYEGFLTDQKTLDDYLDLLSKNPPGENWDKSAALAYWINAYNAFTIKLILDNYPVGSIKDIAGSITMVNSPWDIKFFKIGGVDFDLNTIEHEILRKKFDEPRIHFAINCASISCPDLRKEAYIGQEIDRQLEEQTRIFLRNESKNQLSVNELKLSKIFDWFKSDFTRHGSLVDFLKLYTKLEINPEASIEYLDYDWGLNHGSL
ncbi:DUF547 domain-containing protein [Flexithrix dorotheae]|uniref:DUF547 domain-containing protein n=1 Tax=Flexithrix dorotheae TaxID=70993 RepID=UPI0003695BFD|nr:DUF547 domain-containing protein [Flexithrix dorotheae]